MSTSLRRRLRAIEKKTHRDDESITLTLGDKTFTTTRAELTRVIQSVQGTCLKPVTLGESKESSYEHTD